MRQRVTTTTIDHHPTIPPRPTAPEPQTTAPPRESTPIERLEQDKAYAFERDRLNRLDAMYGELQRERMELVAQCERFPGYRASAHGSAPPDAVDVALGDAAPQRERPSVATRLEQVEQALWKLHEPRKLQSVRTQRAQQYAAHRVALHRKPQRLALLTAVRDALVKAGEAIDRLRADDAKLEADGLAVSAIGRPMVANPGQLGGLASLGGDETRLGRLLKDLDSEIAYVSAAGEA